MASVMTVQPEPLETDPTYSSSSEDSQPYIVIPSSSTPCLRRGCHDPYLFYKIMDYTPYLLLSLLVIFLVCNLCPDRPTIRITDLHITNLHISPPPRASFDLRLTLNLYVENRLLYALDYQSVDSSVSYRGRQVGLVRAAGGRVKPWGGLNLEVVLQVNRVRVVEELVYLIEDLTKGSFPLLTFTEVEGSLNLIFVKVPVKANISCLLDVDPTFQKIVHQYCYSENQKNMWT